MDVSYLKQNDGSLLLFPCKSSGTAFASTLRVTTLVGVSYRSWAAFALSAAFLLVFALVVTQQIAEQPPAEETAPATSDKSPDEPIEVADQAKDVAPQVWESAPKTNEDPESTIEKLVQAWNQGDADKIAELFLSDGVLRLPTGSEIKSREEIKKTIAKHHDGMLKETKLTNSIAGVSTEGDKAVVRGNYQLEGIKVLGFSTSSTGTYEFHGNKRDGRWLIAKAEVTRE
jgi:uncharacterized protein (TIGR02246 family)